MDNTQKASFPIILKELVDKLTYRPGWQFSLEHIDRGQGSEGLTLRILTVGYDTYHPELGENYRVYHYMPVPPAAYDLRSWRRWLLDQIILVERHEACEFFQIDGERYYAPHHGFGQDPYIIFDHGTTGDTKINHLGEVCR